MDFTLSDEQQLIRQTAREFCDAEIAPHATDWDRSEAIDRGIVGKLAELGFLAAALPEANGGMGLDMVSYALVVEEIGRADSNVRGIVSVSNGLYGKTVARWGTDEQKQRLLPGLASGEALGCYALTEPGAGSDPGSLETRAERDGDELGDQRARRSSSRSARGRPTRSCSPARAKPGPRGITCFVVPTGAAGFEARPIKGKLGLRAQDTAELFLDGVRVPDENRARRARQRLQGGDVGARPRPDLARRRAASGSRRAASTRRSPTRRSGGSSAARSRASSSSRSCSPTSPSRPRRRASSCGAPRRSPTPASSTRSRRRSPSTSPARSPCELRTPRFRRTAATATSTSTRSASTCATPA